MIVLYRERESGRVYPVRATSEAASATWPKINDPHPTRPIRFPHGRLLACARVCVCVRGQ